MKTKKTTVTLLSFTSLPVETIYCEWQISRTDGPVLSPQEVRAKIAEEHWKTLLREQPGLDLATISHEDSLGFAVQEKGPFEKEVRKIFEECVAMKVPISETIDFVFGLDHVPIALREQMVRHRVGHKFGGTLGADLIPNLSDSSWWTQTFRAKDLGTFATDGEYLTPDWIEQNGDRPMPGSENGDRIINFLEKVARQGDLELSEEAKKIRNQCGVEGDGKSISWYYHNQFRWIQAAYRRLVKAGMPLEDARNILPLGTQHRMTWKMNLSSLMHVLGNRSCWIAQLGMWEPVILGMVEELTTKVDPFFRRLVDPPCIKGDKFAACPFEKENKEYIHGRDPHLPCPLWTSLQHVGAATAMAEAENPTWLYAAAIRGENHRDDWAYNKSRDGTDIVCHRPVITSSCEQEEKLMAERTAKYVKLWGRDPKTGERKVFS